MVLCSIEWKGFLDVDSYDTEVTVERLDAERSMSIMLVQSSTMELTNEASNASGPKSTY